MTRVAALEWIALERIAPAVLAAAFLAHPAALDALTLEGLLDQQSKPRSRPAPAPSAPVAGAADFTTISARADAARETGRLDDAVSLYRKALAIRGTWTEGWWSLGTIFYEQDRHDDAARAFRRLVSLDPNNGTAHLMLGLCEYQLGANAGAIVSLQTAKRLGVQSDRGLPQVLTYHEGMLFLRGGQYERTLETLKPLAGAGVEDENLDLALGMSVLLIHAKNAPPEGSPTRAIVTRAGRAERHHMAKEFAAAKREYAALVQEAATFPNVHYAYGRFLLATEDLDSGIQEFLKEIDAHPEHIRARVQIAAARYRLDSAAGLPFARDVVKLAPDYPFGHYLLGVLYFDTGDIERAIPELETAVRMRAGEAQFQFALGNAYARAGRADEAARARAAFSRLRKNESSDTGDALKRLDLDSASRPPVAPITPNLPAKGKTPPATKKPPAIEPIKN